MYGGFHSTAELASGKQVEIPTKYKGQGQNGLHSIEEARTFGLQTDRRGERGRRENSRKLSQCAREQMQATINVKCT